jgi:hypothetical protein
MKPLQRRSSEIKALQRAVEEVLFREWDPIGVNSYMQCSDEYGSEAATITRLLCEGADEDKLIEQLGDWDDSNVDVERNRRVAQQLLALVNRRAP